MSIQPKAWLPPEAISSARMEPLLNTLVEAWGRHWFVSARASAAPAFQDDWPKSASVGWRSSPGTASIALTQNVQAAIAGAMLGVNVPAGTLPESDRKIVERL